jgi:hypothetical protein
MSSLVSSLTSSIRIKSIGVHLLGLLLLGTLALASTAFAENPENAKDFWEALTKGTPVLDMRGRIEIAEVGSLDQAEAYTLRTRLGYGTKPWYSTLAFVEFENTAAVATDQYWNLVELNRLSKSPIADPTNTEVNQAYMKIANEDWADLKVVGGRQRIILDDSRFIGNVGWRQNEQTYDGVYGSSSFMLDDFQGLYSYIGWVRRIFGNQDYKPGSSNTFDWHSKTHLINASYSRFSFVKPVAFIYLVELDNPKSAALVSPVRAQSSASYGFRLPGAWEFAEDWKLAYLGSYAYQMDYQNNPTDYSAHYALIDLKLTWSKLGTLGAGWEMLGSDDGTAQFKTPLATLHKWNGWADVFLSSGGRNGLQDAYVTLAPKLPWELKMLLVYHHFRADEGGYTLGNEFDARLSRSFTKHLNLMFKSAYFKASDGAIVGTTAIPDVWRIWLQIGLKI